MSDLYTPELKAELEELKSSMAKEEPVTKVAESVELIDEVVSEPEDTVLAEAVKQGYNPNYNGPGKKTPEEFVIDGSFFRKIEAQNKKIDDLIKLNQQTLEHQQSVEKAAYEKALREITTAKLQAVAEGDLNKFNKLEKQAEETRAVINSKTKSVAAEQLALDPSIIQFQSENKHWLEGNTERDIEKQAVTEASIIFLKKTRPNIAPQAAVDFIKDRLSKEFPDDFTNEKQKQAPRVLTSSVSMEKGTNRGLASRLTTEQEKYWQQAKNLGLKQTKEEYAKQLELTGRLKDE